MAKPFWLRSGDLLCCAHTLYHDEQGVSQMCALLFGGVNQPSSLITWEVVTGKARKEKRVLVAEYFMEKIPTTKVQWTSDFCKLHVVKKLCYFEDCHEHQISAIFFTHVAQWKMLLNSKFCLSPSLLYQSSTVTLWEARCLCWSIRSR